MTTDVDQVVQIDPATDARCCANCRYFHRLSDLPAEVIVVKPGTVGIGRADAIVSPQGQCRFAPPVVVAEAEGPAASTWPTVLVADWCGAFAVALEVSKAEAESHA